MRPIGYEVKVERMYDGRWFVEIIFGNVCEENKYFKTRTSAELWIGERIMIHAEALAEVEAG